VEQGALADVRAWLEGLERELGPQLNGYPLTEPMFQLMCYPVGGWVRM
jgi:nuclear pore complex protein Nup205